MNCGHVMIYLCTPCSYVVHDYFNALLIHIHAGVHLFWEHVTSMICSIDYWVYKVRVSSSTATLLGTRKRLEHGLAKQQGEPTEEGMSIVDKRKGKE